jgi:hypothetical protein
LHRREKLMLLLYKKIVQRRSTNFCIYSKLTDQFPLFFVFFL